MWLSEALQQGRWDQWSIIPGQPSGLANALRQNQPSAVDNSQGIPDSLEAAAAYAAAKLGISQRTVQVETELSLDTVRRWRNRSDVDDEYGDIRDLVRGKTQEQAIEVLLSEIDDVSIDGGNISRSDLRDGLFEFRNSKRYKNLTSEQREFFDGLITKVEDDLRSQVELQADDIEGMFDSMVSQVEWADVNATEFNVTLWGKPLKLIGTKQQVLEEILIHKRVAESEFQWLLSDTLDLVWDVFSATLWVYWDFVSGTVGATWEFFDDQWHELLGGIFTGMVAWIHAQVIVSVLESMWRRWVMDHVGRWWMVSGWHLDDFSRSGTGTNLLSGDLAEQRNEYTQRLEAIQFLKDKAASESDPVKKALMEKKIAKLDRYLNSKSPTFWMEAHNIHKDRGFIKKVFDVVINAPSINDIPILKHLVRFPEWLNNINKPRLLKPLFQLLAGRRPILAINPQSKITAEFNTEDTPRDFLLEGVKEVYPSATRGADKEISIPDGAEESEVVKHIRSAIDGNMDITEQERVDRQKKLNDLLKWIREKRIVYGSAELHKVLWEIVDSWYVSKDVILKGIRDTYFSWKSELWMKDYIRNMKPGDLKGTEWKANRKYRLAYRFYRLVESGGWQGNESDIADAYHNIDVGTKVEPKSAILDEVSFKALVKRWKERLQLQKDAMRFAFDLDDDGSVRNNASGDPSLSEAEPRLQPFVQAYVYYIDLAYDIPPAEEIKRQKRLVKWIRAVEDGEIVGTEAELKSDVYRIARGEVIYSDVITKLRSAGLMGPTDTFSEHENVNKFLQLFRRREWFGIDSELDMAVSDLSSGSEIPAKAGHEISTSDLNTVKDEWDALSKKHFKTQRFGVFKDGKVNRGDLEQHLKISDAIVKMGGGDTVLIARKQELEHLYTAIESDKVDFPVDQFMHHFTEIAYKWRGYADVKVDDWSTYSTEYEGKTPVHIMSEQQGKLLLGLDTELQRIAGLSDEWTKAADLKSLKEVVTDELKTLMKGSETKDASGAKITFTSLDEKMWKMLWVLEITDEWSTRMKWALDNLTEAVQIHNSLHPSSRVSDDFTDVGIMKDKLDKKWYTHKQEFIDEYTALSSRTFWEDLNPEAMWVKLQGLKTVKGDADTRAKLDAEAKASTAMADATVKAAEIGADGPLRMAQLEDQKKALAEELKSLKWLLDKSWWLDIEDIHSLSMMLTSIDTMESDGVRVSGHEDRATIDRARSELEAMRQSARYTQMLDILEYNSLLKDFPGDGDTVSDLRRRIYGGEFPTEASFKAAYKASVWKNPVTISAMLKSAGVARPKAVIDMISEHTTLDALKTAHPYLEKALDGIATSSWKGASIMEKMLAAVKRGKVI